MNSRRIRAFRVLLILGSILAALKLILVDYTMDEEYQVVMAYRCLAGDRLFGTMWEPHQSSAFLCVWLMWVFRAVTGGFTGVIIYLRCCGVLIHGVLAWWFSRVCGGYVRKEYAFLLGICYFNIVPKLIQIPEFSNMQMWFFTILILSLIRYYESVQASERPNRLWLVLSGVAAALEVLSYPSMAVLFPFLLVYIFVRSRDNWRRALADCAIMIAVCGGGAAVWLCGVLSHVQPQEFLRNLRYVVEYDFTRHMSVSAGEKLVSVAAGIKDWLLPSIAVFGISIPVWMILRIRWKRTKTADNRPGAAAFFALLVLSAEAVQLFYWLVLRRGYEMPMIHFVFLLLAVLLLRRLPEEKKVFALGIVGTIGTVIIVIYTSDLYVWYAMAHAVPGVLFGALIITLALEKELGTCGRKWAWIILGSLAVVSVFGKGFTLRGGRTETNSVLGIRNIVRDGPAVGIMMNYMQAYILNSTIEEFREYIEEGADCLIVTNMVGTAGTTPYLYRNSNVCHFSVVDPTSYDERLLTYWEIYPEKYPDVIIVDCWYGQLQEDTDSWIMRYIENEFGYDRMIEGKYLRYYFR